MAKYSFAVNQGAFAPTRRPPTGRAAIFLNAMIPVGMGHVGWGFERCPGWWYYGGLETAGLVIDQGTDNNTNNCFGTYDTMIKNMKTKYRPGCPGSGYPYHDFKLITVSNPNVDQALETVRLIKRGGYGLFGNNCMDAVYNVLCSYANNNTHLLPGPGTFLAPRVWYGAIWVQNNLLQSQWSTGNWFEQHDAQ